MKQRNVSIGPRANRDVRRIGDYIAHFSGQLTAERYVERLTDFVLRLDLAAERGLNRGDIHPGLRIIAFEKSATVAALVDEDAVAVIRVFYRGEDWERSPLAQFARS